MSDLSDIQDGLQKQYVEGFSEYANSFNDLTAKQFARFLLTTTHIRMRSSDLKNFVKDGIKPFEAIRDVILFFTHQGDSVLDVFSGTGESLKIISELGRIPTGIEKDARKIQEYLDSIASDMFSESAEIINSDALEVLSLLSKTYDFVLVDPPIKTQRQNDFAESFADFSVREYAAYISATIEKASRYLKRSGYLVSFVQDFYSEGIYFSIPSLILEKISNLKFRGIKIYLREVDSNSIKNRRVYAPVQNHFYALIFSR